jgi:predicted alpha/beta hydrolase family esterase
MMDSCTVLMVPGYENSGPQHWQTLWQNEHSDYKRVEQKDWQHPERNEWVNALDRAIAALSGKVILVAHSIGCVAVAHWAATPRAQVVGALLVAPADAERPGLPKDIKGFAPMPLKPLPFRSIAVISNDDPYTNLMRARFFASKWKSRLVEVGGKGHLNSDSNLGSWPEGAALLQELISAS